MAVAYNGVRPLWRSCTSKYVPERRKGGMNGSPQPPALSSSFVSPRAHTLYVCVAQFIVYTQCMAPNPSPDPVRWLVREKPSGMGCKYFVFYFTIYTILCMWDVLAYVMVTDGEVWVCFVARLMAMRCDAAMWRAVHKRFLHHDGEMMKICPRCNTHKDIKIISIFYPQLKYGI